MIDLYTWPTPNGHKIHIFMEETGTPYRVIAVDIGAGEQFKLEFLRISPNNKMPAIVDPDGPGGKPISVFESGAILIYLAEKTGRFLPGDARQRIEVLEWLMFQMASVGPMLGQAHHFRVYAKDKAPYATERYTNEARRIYGVLDRRLGDRDWVAAGQYTIADMAIFPWLRSWELQGQDLGAHPNLKRWFDKMASRPAVMKAVEVLAERRRKPEDMTDKTRDILFGTAQYARR
ncbi:MAG: glutathione S-transferase family protein [Alphaproteobacteria bacterium]|nr:glutathione S-transferase family protein [Alphaproteobacteria bacterium]